MKTFDTKTNAKFNIVVYLFIKAIAEEHELSFTEARKAITETLRHWSSLEEEE